MLHIRCQTLIGCDTDLCSDEEEKVAESLFSRRAPHFGAVNRIRAMPQQPSIVATWGDSSIVQVHIFCIIMTRRGYCILIMSCESGLLDCLSAAWPCSL